MAIQGLSSRYSASRGGIQHPVEQLQPERTDTIDGVSLDGEVQQFVFPVDLLVLGAGEDCLAGHQQMEDAADREHIAGGQVLLVLLDLDDLGGDEPRSPAPEEQVGGSLALGSQAKIHDDWLVQLRRGQALVPEHDILWLQVPMHDLVLIHALEPAEQPSHDNS